MKKILIVEDDAFLKGLAAQKLAEHKFEVISAGSAEEAVKLVDTETPDLILLDVILPGDDGFVVLKKIRENVKMVKTPVIIFSNMADPENMKKAESLGATSYMVKSNFTLAELVEKVKSLL